MLLRRQGHNNDGRGGCACELERAVTRGRRKVVETVSVAVAPEPLGGRPERGLKKTLTAEHQRKKLIKNEFPRKYMCATPRGL